MCLKKLLCVGSFGAIAVLASELPVFSEETEPPRMPIEIRLTPPVPTKPSGSTSTQKTGNDCGKKVSGEDNRSKREELYYYRNAENIVELLGKIPLEGGCATNLKLNSFDNGEGVGQGGGNILLLYGSEAYIENAQRFITSLDLPLPGINLQLWGAQLSSKDSRKLADTTSKVRWQISETQRLLRDTFAKIQGISQITLQRNFKQQILEAKDGSALTFMTIAKDLGYEDAIDGLGGESSILEVFLVGNTVERDKREEFYQNLYKQLLEEKDLQPYLDELKNDINRPPFERIFRSRGLEPDCIKRDLMQQDEDQERKCEEWIWKAEPTEQNEKVTLVDITANYERKVLLEFALHYADFIENPNELDPNELKRTADNLNEILQSASNLLQKDIEDLFLKPTLAMIQQEVDKNKEVDFAQIGRSTISTLDGVKTKIGTNSTSSFQVPQSQDLGELLTRAQELQQLVGGFIPTETPSGASEASEIVNVGPLPSSQVIALAVAALEQKSTPIEIETGTSLAFTPGISRNLNSAELNIKLTVSNPEVKPTADASAPPISRIGKQELNTTVYTQALDFFDLSTFTSQATLDGGRFRIPIIGNVWNAIFGAIPVFGDLFSISNGNQNVLHESLILTNSFITPTPLSLGNLYAPNNSNLYTPVDTSNYKNENSNFDFCKAREGVLKYLETLEPGGQASRRDTNIISDRCLQEE